jgi:hypothetical protein
VPPMRFRFYDTGISGLMAFTDGPEHHLLLTDSGNETVHVIDVAGRRHVGFVGGQGSIFGPRGVAASGDKAAVSCWERHRSGWHTVRLYEGAGARWECLWTVGAGFGQGDGQLSTPYGLRFTTDGTGVAVTDCLNGRVSLFAIADGSFVAHLATGLGLPYDVVEHDGGWLVACVAEDSVVFVGGGGDGVGGARPLLSNYDADTGVSGRLRTPTALALVPGLGLMVMERGAGGCVQFFAPPDMIAMDAMSAVRVAWMGAVARALPSAGTHPLWEGPSHETRRNPE